MKEPSKLILSTGILVWCALFSPPCLSAPFTNGSFELLGGLNDNSTIEITSPGFLPGWTVGGIGVTGYIRGIVAGGFDISPFEGSYKLSFNGGNTLAGTWISQTFDTVVGESYELSFYVGRIGGAGDIGLRVSVTNQSGDTLVVQDACPPSTKGWGPLQRLFFTATSLNTTVTFLDISPDTLSVDVALDKVDVAPFPGKLVSGIIVNQVWTSANSPYTVVGDIQVAGLTIQPGVTVIFSGDYVFEVAGVLKAIGTATAPVVFMGTSGGWQGIYFNHSNPGSVLAYCTISNSVNSGIRIVDSNPLIANCVIANNGGVNGGGIYASITDGDLVLQNCTISNNTATSNGGGVGVILSPNNALRMDGCFVRGNIANPTRSSGTGSFYLGGGVYVSGSSFLRNCVVRNNTCYASSGPAVGSGVSFGGGIYSDTGSTDVRNCVISGNEAQASVGGGGGPSVAWGGGIYISSGSLNMANSIISSNITSASTMNGGGVYIESGAHNSSVLNCTLAYNNTEGLDSRTNDTSVMNSILYFNAGGATQVVGVTNVTYCDVQKGFAGTGNINVQPIFQRTSDLIIVPGSLCIDKGNTNSAYNDVYFPPSLGSSRNDMGAHGGPGAGARLRVESWPEVAVFFLGGVPGYNYQIKASTNLLDWQTVQQMRIAHLGDYASFLEPNTNSLPLRFYCLSLGQ